MLHTIQTIALASELNPLFFVITGFGFVILVLGLLAWVTALIAILFRRLGATATADAISSSEALKEVSGAIPPRHLTAVAAAIHAVMDNQDYRVVNVRPEK